MGIFENICEGEEDAVAAPNAPIATSAGGAIESSASASKCCVRRTQGPSPALQHPLSLLPQFARPTLERCASSEFALAVSIAL